MVGLGISAAFENHRTGAVENPKRLLRKTSPFERVTVKLALILTPPARGGRSLGTGTKTGAALAELVEVRDDLDYHDIQRDC